MVEPQRTKTGIPGLDELFNEGIPTGNLVVVSGDPGSGKTGLCLQFLYEGAMQFDENGVYISLEESVEELLKISSYFGWNFSKLISEKKIEFIAIELYDFDKLRNTIEDAVERLKAKRLVIDPGVIFRLFFEKELDARKKILGLGQMLKKIGCTTLITNEISLENPSSLFGLEEYVADGVILLYHSRIEDKFIRSIGVLKMRGTKISEKLHPIKIDKTGIKILAGQEMFEVD